MENYRINGSVSRRSFLQAGTLGAAALSSGFFNSLYAGTPGISAGTPHRILTGAGDNETLQRAKINIPKIRMRDAEIELLNKNGQPLRNMEVNIEQLKHQFLWGDNNWSMATMVRNGQGNSDRLKYYRKRFADILNSLNTTVYWTERPRNDGTKTEDIQGDLRLDDFNESVDWANANGLVAKGHPLFWAVPKAIPDWVQKYDWETQKKFIEVRVRNLCARYRGKVKLWDAVNEMLWEAAPKNTALRQWPHVETMENMVEYISPVIKWARSEDPDALYCINDYGLGYSERNDMTDQNGNPVNAAIQRKRLIELTKRLGDAGSPPNLIGDQSRPAWLMPSAQTAIYDELGETGIPISITEFWAGTNELRSPNGKKIIESEEWRTLEGKKTGTEYSDEEMQLIRDEFVINFITCAFGHPNIHSFFFWGFMSDAVRFSDPALSNHTMNPIYDKIRDLIHKEWNTRLSIKTDLQGMVRFRGYCGDYSLRIKNGNENAPAIGLTFRIDKECELNRRTFKTII
jgi:endo-1,4-beta-xylanase